MKSYLIDGKKIAEDVRATIAERVAQARAAGQRAPGLAVILVGEDPASQVYVRSKVKQTEEIGMLSFEFRLPATISQAELLERIASLNADPRIDGILVQLPLPAGIDADAILNAIDPAKDVDGFHPMNVGRFVTGGRAFVPCTPRGALKLISHARAARTGSHDLSGLNAVVVGRSNIVGKPMATLLLNANCTVTIAHSKTRDLAALCRQADVLVAAIGRPRFLGAEHVKPGAIVIDVGINRIEEGGKSRLVGDCDFAAMAEIAGAITPVPGGAGPMTIACLLENTMDAFDWRR